MDLYLLSMAVSGSRSACFLLLLLLFYCAACYCCNALQERGGKWIFWGEGWFVKLVFFFPKWEQNEKSSYRCPEFTI